MSRKEFLKSLLMQYFIIVTMINVAMAVLGMIFQPEQQFGNEALLVPLFYGLLSLIPDLVTYSPRELSVKQALAKEAVRLVMLEIILITACFGFEHLTVANLPIIGGFALSVLIIYVLVNLVSWFLDRGKAKEMSSDLQAFQQQIMQKH